MVIRKKSFLCTVLCWLPNWLIFVSACRVQNDTTTFVRVQFTWNV
jgi:hypothetical protein